MTNAINSGLPPQADPTAAVPVSPSNNAASRNAAAGGASGTEAVTLSADAQTRTQLLDAARTSPGIDQPAITQLRSAIQSNLYNVAPQTLAAAITGAYKEKQS